MWADFCDVYSPNAEKEGEGFNRKPIVVRLAEDILNMYYENNELIKENIELRKRCKQDEEYKSAMLENNKNNIANIINTLLEKEIDNMI